MAATKQPEPPEQFIRVEMSDKKHIIASRLIGGSGAYNYVAETKNRGHAERMVNKLNGVA